MGPGTALSLWGWLWGRMWGRGRVMGPAVGQPRAVGPGPVALTREQLLLLRHRCGCHVTEPPGSRDPKLT